jgi:CRP/FNR family transcriptional regulator
MKDQVFINAFPCFADMPEEEKSIIRNNTFDVLYKKGTNVHDSTECTGVILIETGSLRVYMLSDEGKEITLYRLYAGDMCMMSASCVLDSITFDVFVDAEEDSQCKVIAGCAFAEVADRVPALKIFSQECALSRFSDVMWVMQQIMFMSFDKRLAIFLLDEVAKNGSNEIKLTHEQIAKYMASAREVVSRMLKYFSNEGIVEVSRKGVKIVDKKRLRELTL